MTTTAPPPVPILLVDDLGENLLALEALLRRDGLLLLQARSGPAALELLLRHEVALALVDVRMPGMDGFELAELMRGTERTRRVPIIFVTAGTEDRQRRFRGYEAGAVDFIHKPIEADVLRSKADVFVELYRQREEVIRQRDELRAATEENARLLADSRRAAEALRESDRRKDEFLAVLAHELRNPLAPIRSALRVLRMTGDGAARERSQAVMERQLGHMVRMIDDLLDVSRISRNKVELRRTRVPLADVVDSAVETARPAIDEAGHELTVSLPPEAVLLDGDPTRLSQVFANLLTNSAKYTNPGGRIRLTADAAGGRAVVAVSDTGVGIPPDALATIFDMFSQVDRSLERTTGGLGIGLALVKGLVEMHGGSVTAASGGQNLGSTFTVTLPLARAELPTPAVERPTPAPVPVSRRRVLVADDNADGAESMAMVFQLLGDEVRVARDGVEAVAVAESFRPGLILMDVGMPRLNGLEATRQIRERPWGDDIIIVALTGWGQDDDRQRSDEAGCDGHLVKPVELAELQSFLETLGVGPAG